MRCGRVHTLYRRGSWMVELEDGGVLSIHDVREDALAAGEAAAASLSTDHLVHAEDGLVIEERRHGSEPARAC